MASYGDDNFIMTLNSFYNLHTILVLTKNNHNVMCLPFYKIVFMNSVKLFLFVTNSINHKVALYMHFANIAILNSENCKILWKSEYGVCTVHFLKN